MVNLQRLGPERRKLVQELPSNAEVAAVRRYLEPGHVAEPACCQIHPVPIHGETAQLELDQAPEEGCSSKGQRCTQWVSACYPCAPALDGKPQFQIKSAARKF